MILEIENIGHDDIPPQNSIACTRIIEKKAGIRNRNHDYDKA